MSRKSFIMLGVFVGTTLGSFVPALWGADGLSLSSVVMSGVGGALGIWIAWKATD